MFTDIQVIIIQLSYLFHESVIVINFFTIIWFEMKGKGSWKCWGKAYLPISATLNYDKCVLN